MTGNEIRKKYLDFMVKKGHAVVPSAALVPDNDPTTLFTGSGMQPMVPYLLGESHPRGTRIVDSQKCFRAEDIEEVGDNRHTTFFEMLGNWSFGDYFKEEQIQWIFEFLIDEVQLDPNKIYITVFGGDKENNLPADEEAPVVWKRLFEKIGIEAKVAHIGSEEEGYKRGMREGERIFYYNSKKNWWSRAGVPSNMPAGEPGGPDSEMFYDFGTKHDPKWGEHCHPNCDCGRFVEIGNNVFMQYVKNQDGTFSELENKNIDFGGGLERIAAAAIDDGNGGDVFKIDLLWGLIEKMQELSSSSYEEKPYAYRVIADHLRGSIFMIADGILPGNTEQGYFVRRLLRRSVRFADMLEIPAGQLQALVDVVVSLYKDTYPILVEKSSDIKATIAVEEEQFRRTLENGLKQFNKISLQIHMNTKVVDGKKILDRESAITKKAIDAHNAFALFTTYGFPIELTEEIATERGLIVDRAGFEQLMEEHREKSRAGAEHKFKGGLADQGEKTVQYHTTTHLMLAALRRILGSHVHQAGSNITSERLRYDFTHPEKLTPEILKEVENWVNTAIKTGGKVETITMSKDSAQQDEMIEGSFWDRYPEQVKVYVITGNDGTIFSKELCGGPHVAKLEDIHGTFKINKEESSSAGVRRIKAVLEV